MVDSLKIFEVLKTSFPEAQARVMTLAIQQAESDFSIDVGTRFDRAMSVYATKVELAQLEAKLIRWMFVFWVGQVAATAGIVFGALKLMAR